MFFTTINITKEEMLNIFQRLLYILGTISPYAIITSICYGGRISYSVYAKWIEKSNEINANAIPIKSQKISVIILAVPEYVWIIIAVSAILLIYHILFLKISLNSLPQMDFHANKSPEENDGFAKGLGFIYLLPIIEWILTEKIFNVSEQASGWFLLIIGILAFFISLFANKSYDSPVYWIMGYHFHTIQTDKSKSYVLMSRKKHFRNKDQVKRIIRLFEDLLINVS